MHKLPLSSLTEPIQVFLRQVRDDGTLIIEDGQTGVSYKVTTYREPTAERRAQAWETIQQMQVGVGRAMQEQGVREEDVDRLLLEDD